MQCNSLVANLHVCLSATKEHLAYTVEWKDVPSDLPLRLGSWQSLTLCGSTGMDQILQSSSFLSCAETSPWTCCVAEVSAQAIAWTLYFCFKCRNSCILFRIAVGLTIAKLKAAMSSGPGFCASPILWPWCGGGGTCCMGRHCRQEVLAQIKTFGSLQTNKWQLICILQRDNLIQHAAR